MREEMDFGTALDVLRMGKKVAREGWNGVGMWLMMAKGVDVRTEFGTVNIGEMLVIKSADSSFSAWFPSSLDLLSTDWIEVA